MDEKRLYFAAALFNARESVFNVFLVEALEKLGYSFIFPQRDGFVFTALAEALSQSLPVQEVVPATRTLIYLLDIGYTIPCCSGLLANLDEPLDPGVIVEATYARLFGKHVTGFRTDLKGQYGPISDKFNGMHTFVTYQCHDYIYHPFSCTNPQDVKTQLDCLAARIAQTFQGSEPASLQLPPDLAIVREAGSLLFSGIADIHSKAGLAEIVQRYQRHKTHLIDHYIVPRIR